jgi:hypothetical protein
MSKPAPIKIPFESWPIRRFLVSTPAVSESRWYQQPATTVRPQEIQREYDNLWEADSMRAHEAFGLNGAGPLVLDPRECG